MADLCHTSYKIVYDTRDLSDSLLQGVYCPSAASVTSRRAIMGHLSHTYRNILLNSEIITFLRLLFIEVDSFGGSSSRA